MVAFSFPRGSDFVVYLELGYGNFIDLYCNSTAFHLDCCDREISEGFDKVYTLVTRARSASCSKTVGLRKLGSHTKFTHIYGYYQFLLIFAVY